MCNGFSNPNIPNIKNSQQGFFINILLFGFINNGHDNSFFTEETKVIRFIKRKDTMKRIFFMDNSCCSPELNRMFMSKHDPERLELKRTHNIQDADILIINGYTKEEALKELEKKYELMTDKPIIIAVGGCAIDGGPLKSKNTELRINVFIPGCPPRPEAIIHGILKGLSKK